MTDVSTSADCGNSPKNRFLQDFVIAIARADVAGVNKMVAADVRWLPVGRQEIEGAQKVTRAMTRYGAATSIFIEHAISHGKSGSVNGVVDFGDKQRGFCFVFEFSSAKGNQISGITSYSIPLK